MHREPLTLQAGQALLLLLRRGRLLLESRTMRRGVKVAHPCRCSLASFRSPSSSSSEGPSKHFLLSSGGVRVQDGSLSDKSLSPCWRWCACGGRRRRRGRRRSGKGVVQGREVERLGRATVLEELLRGCSIADIGRCGSERVLLGKVQSVVKASAGSRPRHTERRTCPDGPACEPAKWSCGGYGVLFSCDLCDAHAQVPTHLLGSAVCCVRL